MTDDRMLTDDQRIARVKHYVKMRQEKPLKALADGIHTIHAGEEWEAELLVSDLAAVLRHIEALQQEWDKLSAFREAINKRLEGLAEYWRHYPESEIKHGPNEKMHYAIAMEVALGEAELDAGFKVSYEELLKELGRDGA